jgi:hypothetical protein
MAYTDIDKPTDYFNTKLYTGTGSSNAITGVGFQPDWVWIKCRDDTHNHQVFDVVRGVHKRMRTDTDGAETESSESLKSFDSDGFTLGTQANVNNPSNTFASWNWLASNTTASNTDGSITSTVSANTTSGFSIVSYTGNGSTNQSVGHGLSQAPEILITKGRTNVQNWAVYGSVIGVDKRLYLNTTDAVDTLSGYLPADTSSVINLSGTSSMSNINTSSIDYITYAFHSVKGYSKIGTYTGNGSTDGTFVYTGFKPAFIIVKRTDAIQSWYLLDNKRNTFNPEDKYFKVDASSAEDTLSFFDFVSNGFKARGTGIGFNSSGGSFIYMAFAESPFVTSTGIPTVAR